MDNAFMFFNELQEALSHIPRLQWHGLTLKDHEEFNNQLIFRQKRVLEYFKFFLNNEKNRGAIPRVSGKYGSAKLFLNLIDQEYNEPILATMKNLKDDSYPKLEDFIHAYMGEATKQYHRTRSVIHGVPFSGVKPKRPDRADETPHQQQKREYVRDDDRKRECTRNRFQTRQSQALNAVQDSEQFSSHDSDDEASVGRGDSTGSCSTLRYGPI
jgi:hypothetical protein